jgi:hypothetical protein
MALARSPFASASRVSSAACKHGPVGLALPARVNRGRKSVYVSAILSSGPRQSVEQQQPPAAVHPPVKALSLGAPLPETFDHQPAFERDSVIAHAGGDAASDAVPLPPEPQRQPSIDINWLNTVVDSTVKVCTHTATNTLYLSGYVHQNDSTRNPVHAVLAQSTVAQTAACDGTCAGMYLC